MARLLLDTLRTCRMQHRYLLHEFVLMPEHFHLLLTPMPDVSLEKAMQLIKGSFSFRVKHEMGSNFEIWQPGPTNHRIRDAADYARHVEYIRENPVKRHLVSRAEEYPYSSASRALEVDPAPAPGVPGTRGVRVLGWTGPKGPSYRDGQVAGLKPGASTRVCPICEI